jgi:hypothetical protein
LLAAAAFALTSSLAFGAARGAAPKPAAAPATVEVVNKAQQHLLEIGYWGGSTSDRAAERARCAILAFQRVEGRNQTGKFNAADAQAALAAMRPTPRETGYSHIEVDLKRQVLFVVDQKIGVTLVLPVSSGSGKLYTFEGKTNPGCHAAGPLHRLSQGKRLAQGPAGNDLLPQLFR